MYSISCLFLWTESASYFQEKNLSGTENETGIHHGLLDLQTFLKSATTAKAGGEL